MRRLINSWNQLRRLVNHEINISGMKLLRILDNAIIKFHRMETLLILFVNAKVIPYTLKCEIFVQMDKRGLRLSTIDCSFDFIHQHDRYTRSTRIKTCYVNFHYAFSPVMYHHVRRIRTIRRDNKTCILMSSFNL